MQSCPGPPSRRGGREVGAGAALGGAPPTPVRAERGAAATWTHCSPTLRAGWGGCGRRGGVGAREARARPLPGRAGTSGNFAKPRAGARGAPEGQPNFVAASPTAARGSRGAPSPGRGPAGRRSLEGERGREGESFCLRGEGAAARTAAQVEGRGLGAGGCGENICSALMRGEAAAAARGLEQSGGGAPASKGSRPRRLHRLPGVGVGVLVSRAASFPERKTPRAPPLSQWFQIPSESPKVFVTPQKPFNSPVKARFSAPPAESVLKSVSTTPQKSAVSYSKKSVSYALQKRKKVHGGGGAQGHPFHTSSLVGKQSGDFSASEVGSPSASEPPLPVAAPAPTWGPGEEGGGAPLSVSRTTDLFLGVGRSLAGGSPTPVLEWSPLGPSKGLWSRDPFPPGAGGRGCFRSCLKIIPGYIVTIKQLRLVFFCSELGCFLWGEEVKGGEDLRGSVPARSPLTQS